MAWDTFQTVNRKYPHKIKCSLSTVLGDKNRGQQSWCGIPSRAPCYGCTVSLGENPDQPSLHSILLETALWLNFLLLINMLVHN